MSDYGTIELDSITDFYISTGLAGTFQFGGYEGFKLLALISCTQLISPGVYIYRMLTFFLELNYHIGYGISLAIFPLIFSVGSAFIIKKFGNTYTKTLLEFFNREQNKISMKSDEINCNINYYFNIYFGDILCLKKSILQISALLSLIALTSINHLFNEHLIYLIIGVISLYCIAKDKIFLIPISAILTGAIDPKYRFSIAYYYGTIMIKIGLYLTLTGIISGTFALFSSFIKNCENKKISSWWTKQLDKLEDQKKRKEYEDNLRVLQAKKIDLENERKRLEAKNSPKFVIGQEHYGNPHEPSSKVKTTTPQSNKSTPEDWKETTKKKEQNRTELKKTFAENVVQTHKAKKATKPIPPIRTLYTLPSREQFSKICLSLNSGQLLTFNTLFDATGNTITSKSIKNLAKKIAEQMILLDLDSVTVNEFMHEVLNRNHNAHSHDTGNKLPENFLKIRRTSFVKFGLFPLDWIPSSVDDVQAHEIYKSRL